MNHVHVPLLFITVGFIMILDKIILFNWNMERPPETTVQPQGLYGPGLGQLIRKTSMDNPFSKGESGECILAEYREVLRSDCLL
jgi:hypothetical protein